MPRHSTEPEKCLNFLNCIAWKWRWRGRSSVGSGGRKKAEKEGKEAKKWFSHETLSRFGARYFCGDDLIFIILATNTRKNAKSPSNSFQLQSASSCDKKSSLCWRRAVMKKHRNAIATLPWIASDEKTLSWSSKLGFGIDLIARKQWDFNTQ